MISLLCFTKTKKDIEHTILDSAELIRDIPGLKNNIAQFVKGVVLLLCDKFVKDELLNIRITNLVGGNMKNVEDYAQRVADKAVKKAVKKAVNDKNEQLIINMGKKGMEKGEIAELVDVSIDFVEKTLAK